MTTFFTILLILIGANGLFMVFSLGNFQMGFKSHKKQASETTSNSKVYPLNELSSKYKKAI
ncbi:hypothetical protein [Pareuzebyella sediminis]|uniref:hypothetical protein n=1 Tax=Pareuzebyella sediminis TaxID=2607998 RepID=UPI0011EFD5DD|nr:hypothetical protein [Pareuzebyella sediminis]